MAYSGAPNSTTVDSCNLDRPGRNDSTRTGMRTAGSAGKNRANCSLHPRSLASSAIFRFCPGANGLVVLRATAAVSVEAHTRRGRGRNVPSRELHAKRHNLGSSLNLEPKEIKGLSYFPCPYVERMSQAETLLSHSLLRQGCDSLWRLRRH